MLRDCDDLDSGVLAGVQCGESTSKAQSSAREPAELADFDLGLAVLSALRGPRQCFTRHQIASACGVCEQTIVNIETRALAKLRKALLKAGAEPADLDFTEHSYAHRTERGLHD